MSHVVKYESCLSKDECWRLIQHTVPVLGKDFRTTVAAHRSGFRWKVGMTETKKIQRYASRLTGMPIENVEPVEVVRYEAGASYPLHGDLPWRSHTVLVYLNDGYAGGRTFFARQKPDGWRVHPNAGWALTWENSTAPGKPIPSMDHCVEPLIEGVKWVAVCWIQWQRVDPDLMSGLPPAWLNAG